MTARKRLGIQPRAAFADDAEANIGRTLITDTRIEADKRVSAKRIHRRTDTVQVAGLESGCRLLLRHFPKSRKNDHVRNVDVGWLMGLEPTTTGITIPGTP